MSETPNSDFLAQLWQSGPKPDTQSLMVDLRRLQKVHQWQQRILIFILCATAVLLTSVAIIQRSAALGGFAALWIAFVAGAIWYGRARCRAADALDLDTVSLLKRMIKRARHGLSQARRLYAGVPLAAAAGAIVTRIVTGGQAVGHHGPEAWVTVAYTVASLILLVFMVAAGLVLARARQSQIRQLGEALRSLEDDV